MAIIVVAIGGWWIWHSGRLSGIHDMERAFYRGLIHGLAESR